jgi:hypothetical protein
MIFDITTKQGTVGIFGYKMYVAYLKSISSQEIQFSGG